MLIKSVMFQSFGFLNWRETKYRHGGLSLKLLTLNQVTVGCTDKSPIVLFINQTH